LAVNHLADRTYDEIRSSRRQIRSSDYYNDELNEETTNNTLPNSWDWRDKGVVSMVKVRVMNYSMQMIKFMA
jgi:hypothetical protein